jgi:hypothetical protein
MSRFFRIFGITLVLVAILVFSLAGTVFAAGGDAGKGNRGEECPYGDNVTGDCEPNYNSCNYSYEYASPGPHGQKNAVKNGEATQTQQATGECSKHCWQKGKIAE